MIKIATLLLILISTMSHADTRFPRPDIGGLEKADRLNLVSAYRDFVVDLENLDNNDDHPQYSFNSLLKQMMNSFTAYAGVGGNCIYAGWPSRLGSSGFCDRPETAEGYKTFSTITNDLGFEDGNPAGFQKCSSQERMCNPVLFGPVCVPFDTKFNRVRATSNCDRESRAAFPNGFDYASYVAENLSEDQVEKLTPWFESQFAELQETAESVCTDGSKKQARTAVCRILEEKLKADFPYHSQSAYPPRDDSDISESSDNMSYQREPKYVKQNTGKGNNKLVVKNSEPVTEQGLKNLEYKIQDLNLKINNILGSKECTDPSVAKVVNKQYNTIQLMDPKSGEFLNKAGSECLKKLKPLLDNRTMLLSEYEKSFNHLSAQGCEEDIQADPLSVEKQITEMNKIVAEKACDANPQKWTLKSCGKAYACAVGSSIFYRQLPGKLGDTVAKKLGFSKDCLSQSNDCVMKIATAAANAIWSLLKSLPELASMAWDGVKWVGNKVYSWMPWVTESEKKLSDANHAAMNTLGKNEESTLTKIGNFFSDMWTMLKEYVTDDLMCTEPGWEIERFKKDAHCNQPFVSWNCLTCAGGFSALCNIIGAVGSEFIVGLLTGGAGNAIKGGVKAISLAVKVGTRATLKKQMMTISGKAFQNVVKTGVKVSTHAKAPVLLTRSYQKTATQFLKKQKAKFVQTQKWVNKNVAKVTTPIAKRSKVAGNITELAIEGTGKVLTKTGHIAKNVVTAPLKIPGMALKVVGRILDPFKLGEKGFALGFRATEGLFPMASFVRITNFGYDMANISQEITAASNATRAVDRTSDLLKMGSKQMDSWIAAAKKGELTQAEFNQLQELLGIVKSTKSKYASNLKALDRMSDAEKKFLEQHAKLEEVLGSDKVKRLKAYSGDKYSGLEKGKLRNMKTGAESNIQSVEVLKKQSGDIVLTVKPGNEKLLVVDEIDGQLVAYTKSGDQVLISSGNLSKDANRFVHSKLKQVKDEERFADAQNLFKKGASSDIDKRVVAVEKAEDVKPQNFVQKIQTQVKAEVNDMLAPVNNRIERSSLKSQISQGKNTPDFTTNPEMQKTLDQHVTKVKDGLVKRIKTENLGDVQVISKDLALLDEAKDVASPQMKLQIENYKKEIYSSIKDNSTRNRLSNLERGHLKGADFGSKENTVSIYEPNGTVSKRAYEAKVTVKIDKNGVYARLDKSGASEPVRLIDETENSFVGFNAEGQLVHIKKSTFDSKVQKDISFKLAQIDPDTKAKILTSTTKMNERSLLPLNDPDFRYSVPLAMSEIRVGDDIVKLRRWQAGSNNMKENLVPGGSVTLKSSKGDAIQIDQIHEQGNYWIGYTGPSKQKVIMPKHLLDSETNKLMSRGYNFTKFKAGVRKRMGFVTGYNRKTKLAEVDKTFRAKYKYANYFIKYNMSVEAFKSIDPSTLEQIADKVYLHDLGNGDADIIDMNDNLISTEELELQDAALEDAVMSDETFDFNDVSDSDMEF